MKAKIKSKLNLENRTALQEVIPLSTPYLLYIDPSSLCNFHCVFCPSGHHNLIQEAGFKQTILSLELFKKTIDSLAAFPEPIKVIRLNKIGEPLLNRNLAKMIAYAKNSGYVKYIDFATNGALLNREMILELIAAGTDRINLSIEGVNQAQYKKYCAVDIEFDKLLSNIKFLYENKQQCEITAKIPKNYLTPEDEKKFFELFGDCCDRIFIENLVSTIWPEFEIREHTAAIEFAEKMQYDVGSPDRVVCTDIFYALAINADGTVSSCCSDWKQKQIMGDLNFESLIEIWNSAKLKELRLQHLRGESSQNPLCRTCGHLKYAQVDDIDSYREEILSKFIENTNE